MEMNFYMKIVDLDKIYNSLVLSFFSFKDVKMLNKSYKISVAH